MDQVTITEMRAEMAMLACCIGGLCLNALECFYAWNEYLKVMSEQNNRGSLQ
jgi:hypothetical protein